MTSDDATAMLPSPRSRLVLVALSVIVVLGGVAALIELWRPPHVLRSLPDSLVSAGVFEAGPPTGNAFVGHCAIAEPAAGGSPRAAEILFVEHFRRSGWHFLDPPTASRWATTSGARGDATATIGPLAAYLSAFEDDVRAVRPPHDVLRRADIEASVLACIEDYGHPLRQLK